MAWRVIFRNGTTLSKCSSFSSQFQREITIISLIEKGILFARTQLSTFYKERLLPAGQTGLMQTRLLLTQHLLARAAWRLRQRIEFL
ncbi:hypothetical protein DS901_02740 [Loktanella sp. D2R18]|nr:hypothetical protein DS901_02740 [Loktanella sp. D2R18]